MSVGNFLSTPKMLVLPHHTHPSRLLWTMFVAQGTAKYIRLAKMSCWIYPDAFVSRRMCIFLPFLWVCLLGASPVSGYFLGDTKAVLNGCKDHWTLQDRTAMPLLFHMTVCVDVRMVDPGAWVAFSYSSAHAPKPELGLEGDMGALYGWLLGVRHRFPISLTLDRWHRVCLRRNVPGNSFSLELDGRLVAERTVIAQAIPPSGSLWLGCRPRQLPPGAAVALGRVEVYMFRMWADLAHRGFCEDGAVIGWDARFWGVTSPRARQRDDNLPCAQTPGFGGSFSPPPFSTSTVGSLWQSEPPSVVATPRGHVAKTLPMTPPTTPGPHVVVTNAAVPSSTLAPPSSSSLALQLSISTLAPPTRSLLPAAQTTATTTPRPLMVTTNVEILTSTLATPSNLTPTSQVFSSTPAPPPWSPPTADHTPPTTMPRPVLVTTGAEVLSSTLDPPSNPSSANHVSNSTQTPPPWSPPTAGHTPPTTMPRPVLATTGAEVLSSTLDPPSNPSSANHVSNSTQTPPPWSPPTADHTPPTTMPHPALVTTGAEVLTSTSDPPSNPSPTNQVSSSTQTPPTRPPSPAAQTTLTTTPLRPISATTTTTTEVPTVTLALPANPSPTNQVSSSTQAPPTKSSPFYDQITSGSRLCDCTAFCNTTSQFFALGFNINSAAVNVDALQSLLSRLPCSPMSGCKDYPNILKYFQGVHLECDGTHDRLNSCMVIVEVSGPVDGCSLGPLVKEVIGSYGDVTNQTSLARMVVCGSPGMPLHHLLASNLSWSAHDLLMSDICRHDAAPLHCATNQTRALLLADSCPPSLTVSPAPINEATPTTATDHDEGFANMAATARAAFTDGTTCQRNTTQSSAVDTKTTTDNPPESYNVTAVGGQGTNVTTLSSADVTTRLPNKAPATTTELHPTAANTTGNEKSSSPNVTTQLQNATISTSTTSDTVLGSVATPEPQQNSILPEKTQTLATTFGNKAVPSTPLITATPLTDHTTINTNTTANNNDSTSAIFVSKSTNYSKLTPREGTPMMTTETFPDQDNSTGAEATSITLRTPVTSTLSSGTKKNLEEQADKLLERAQDASKLNSSQVADVVEQLEKLLDAASVSQAVGRKAISIVSHLMESDPRALSSSSNRIIRLVEDLGLKLVVSGVAVVLSSGSLVLAVQKVDGSNFPEMSINIYNTGDVQLSGLSRSESRKKDSTMGSVYLPSSIAEGLSPEEQRQLKRVQFTFYTKPVLFQDDTLNNQTVVSSVLASSVANLSISNLTENISFTIRNLHPIHADYKAVCAFWNFTMNGGAGGWSSAGCFVVNSTPWGTTCTCDHLTSFAILLDLSREGIKDPQQAQILTFITYIGCGISAIFVAATLLTYLSFEKLLRDIPAKILVQLCFSLLLLNLVYLLDGWLALYPARGLCISTAFFLHYFLLTSFTWAGLEALHMYLSIVQVFTPYLSRYMLKFSLIGWGAPVVVVVVVISVDKDNYGLVKYGRYTDGTSDDFCPASRDRTRTTSPLTGAWPPTSGASPAWWCCWAWLGALLCSPGGRSTCPLCTSSPSLTPYKVTFHSHHMFGDFVNRTKLLLILLQASSSSSSTAPARRTCAGSGEPTCAVVACDWLKTLNGVGRPRGTTGIFRQRPHPPRPLDSCLHEAPLSPATAPTAAALCLWTAVCPMDRAVTSSSTSFTDRRCHFKATPTLVCNSCFATNDFVYIQ
ncbi:mucin-17-like isoform X2 [Dunckerocampus dactyliophorus]|uniref:mucin-17-like isoform X2 n=1 Tax=Dunckerocampus dactyliophorus TaxID=161453 RepID=UPI002405AC80|nr:mucin-17-like isoform X2 [Dunckerocampus dactyliophorus]